MDKEIKKWHDRTAGKSKIENLNFTADRFWEECEITIKGEEKNVFGTPNQEFTIYLNGEKIFDDALFGTKTIKKSIKKNCTISVTGVMGVNLGTIPPAVGGVEVCCTYTGPVLHGKSVTWSDATAGISCIDRLFLDDEHIWEKCEIKVEGNKDKSTGCMVTLIADGDFAPGNLPGWTVLNGTESKIYTFEIGKKVPLVVAGYITNHAIVGGGAKITLTGFYKQ